MFIPTQINIEIKGLLMFHYSPGTWDLFDILLQMVE